MALTKIQQAERQKAIEKLREMLKPGDTVHVILRHVSKSGMMRVISPVVLGKGYGGDTWHPTYLVGKALGWPVDERQEGVKVSGCGTDAGFELVYNLSCTLFPEGFGCIGEGDTHGSRCPSNDHSNGDRSYAPHTDEAPHWHQSGGYALRYRWL